MSRTGRASTASAVKVVCFLFDPHVGGPTIRAGSVSEGLQREGYEVRIAFPSLAGTAPAYVREKGIPVDALRIVKPALPRRPWAFLKYVATIPLGMWRILRYLRRERPDLIHVNGAFDVLPPLAGRIAGIPVVWHLNDTVFKRRLSLCLGWLVRRVATVIVVSARRVGEHYGVMDAHPQVVFAPVDVRRFPARDLAGFPCEQPTLVLIGNWNWIKGHDRFVSVIAGLRERGVEARGLAIGRLLEGQRHYWGPVLARIERLGLKEAIEVPGFLDDPSEALAQADLLVLTSHSEAYPMAVLEAMSVGVPVVAFDVGGVREMLGEGEDAVGIIVPPGDVESMVEAAAALLADPQRYGRLARAGQSRVRANFPLEACVERHKAAYASAISRRPEGVAT